MNYVYWVFDNTCSSIDDGYVGVTAYPRTRLATHKRRGRVPKESQMKILFEGSRERCFEYEKDLRPLANIGWNNAPGGSHGWKMGFTHSDETKKILREKWTDERRLSASVLRKEENKKLVGQKRPNQSNAMTGEKNPMYGKPRTNHVKEALRKANLGREPSNKQKNYCSLCGERVSISIMKKYHGLNKKACVTVK